MKNDTLIRTWLMGNAITVNGITYDGFPENRDVILSLLGGSNPLHFCSHCGKDFHAMIPGSRCRTLHCQAGKYWDSNESS